MLQNNNFSPTRTGARTTGSNPRSKGTNPRTTQLALVTDGYTQRAPLEASAQSVVASAVDQARDAGIPVHRRTIGQLAGRTKELLEDGFDPAIVLASCVEAIKLAKPSALANIASQMAAARAGHLRTWRDFDRVLQNEMEIARLERP